jgi:hypothetical protein
VLNAEHLQLLSQPDHLSLLGVGTICVSREEGVPPEFGVMVLDEQVDAGGVTAEGTV